MLVQEKTPPKLAGFYAFYTIDNEKENIPIEGVGDLSYNGK